MGPTLILLISVGFSVGALAEVESNFYYEEQCGQSRGFCLLEKECPHSVTNEYKNLCPMQKNDGAVCCKNFPQEKVNCFQLHNDCLTTKCPAKLDLGRKGCPKGETCCVLVR